MKRYDFLFSLWLFVWFLLYTIGIVSVSPAFALFVALIYSILLLIAIIMKRATIQQCCKLVVVTLSLKLIPLYLTISDTWTILSALWALLIFIVYLFWIYYNHKTFHGIYSKVFQIYSKK